MSAFNPYLQWLGISDANGTPNHYRLLGLRLFEDAPSVISKAVSRLTDEVNGHLYGLHGPEARRILKEIEVARACLLNASSKAAYDGELRKQWSSAAPNSMATTSREAKAGTPAPPAAVTWHSAGPTMPLPPGSPLPPGAALPPSQPSPPTSAGRASGQPSMSVSATPVNSPPLPPGAKASGPPGDDVLLPPTASGAYAAMPAPPSSYTAPTPPGASYPAPPPPTSYPAPPASAYPAAPAYPAAAPYPIPVAPMGYSPTPQPPNYGYPAAVPVAPVMPQAAAVAIPMAAPAGVPGPVYAASVPMQQAAMPVAQAVPSHVSAAPQSAPYEAEPELISTRSRLAWRRQKSPSAGMILGAATAVLVIAAMIVLATHQPEDKVKTEPAVPIARSPKEPLGKPKKTQREPVPATPVAKIEPLPLQEEPKPMVQEKPAPAVVSPPVPAPAPPKPSPPPPKPAPTVPDAQKDAAVTAALGLARAALSKNDPRTARTQVDAARQAMATNRDTEIDRVDALANYMAEFNKAMREGIKGLEVGGQFMFKDTVVGVVEVSDENLILRDAGMNKTFPMRNLPPDIAYALAESWLNKSDATSKIILGTYQAMHPQGNRAMARQLWNIAAADGAKEMAELLLPELGVPLAEGAAPGAAMADDSKPGADGRLKLPSATAQGQARKDVQQAFQADYGAAKDAATMSALSTKLLERAEQPSETAAARYILLLEAGRFAAAAGEFDRMAVALDKLGERYSADPLELKIDMMFESSKHVEGKALNEALATAALALCDEAVLSDKIDLAQKIVRTAKSAATKSGNAELGKQCSSREKDIKELKK